MTRRTLARNEVVGKVTCKKGQELGVDAKQRVVFCTTAKAADVDGLPIAANAYTLFHPSGRIYQTHLRAKLETSLGDGSKLTCGADLIAVGDDGTVRYCRLAAPRAVTPRARVGEGIAFHGNGRTAGMTLDEPYRVAGLEIPAGSSLWWDDRGVVIGGRLASAITTNGLAIAREFSMHANGKLHEIELAAKATVSGHTFPEHAKLVFRADGTLERASYVDLHGFMPHGEMWTETLHLTFKPDGTIATSRHERWQSTTSMRKF